jgi:uncharacterized membrane protein
VVGRWEHEQHIEIATPPDAVYRYLADFTSHLDWSGSVIAIEPPEGGKYVVGGEFVLTGPASRDTRRARVTALQAPMRIAWEASSARVSERWEFLLLPSAAGTTLALRLSLRTHGTLRWLLRDRWRTRRVALEQRIWLERIKAILEAEAEKSR